MKDIIADVKKFREILAVSILSKYIQKKIKLEIGYKAAKRNPLVILIIAIVLFSIFLIILQNFPEWQVARFGIDNSTMVAQLENSYRATLAQMIGGFALLLGLYFTWKNVLTAKESQITELFTRAIDQLGNQNLEVRLGGIYALERISAQSKKDHWPIIEILTAFIKKNSPNEDLKDKEVQKQNKIPLDIQAILTIIGRRKYVFFIGEPAPIDLGRTNLQEANLFGTNLTDISFRDSNLSGANLRCANLSRADLSGADLSGAELGYANLERAYLEGANLKGANLERVNLGYANLEGANLEGADLERVNLGYANLKGVNLKGTNLKRARKLSFGQISKVETLYDTKLDKRLFTFIKNRYPNLLLGVPDLQDIKD